MSNEPVKCDQCGTTLGMIMTCTYAHDGDTIDLCTKCMEEDGSWCMSCGQFCAGIETFDFVHPGYCDSCWDEIEDDDYWPDDEEYDEHDEEEFPNGSLDY